MSFAERVREEFERMDCGTLYAKAQALATGVGYMYAVSALASSASTRPTIPPEYRFILDDFEKVEDMGVKLADMMWEQLLILFRVAVEKGCLDEWIEKKLEKKE